MKLPFDEWSFQKSWWHFKKIYDNFFKKNGEAKIDVRSQWSLSKWEFHMHEQLIEGKIWFSRYRVEKKEEKKQDAYLENLINTDRKAIGDKKFNTDVGFSLID